MPSPPSSAARATPRQPTDREPLVAIGAVVLVLAAAVLLREVASLLVPVLFGLFLALVARPLVATLERRGAPYAVALGLTILVVLGAVFVTAAIVAVSIGELVVLIPRYENRLTDDLAGLRTWLAGFGIATDAEALRSIISPDQIMAVIRPIASTVSSGGVALLVLALTMIYALVGAASLQSRAEAAFGREHPLLGGVARFGEDLRRYLVVRAGLGLFAAVLVFVLLLILGVPLPALWAFLVFAASFVPNVGVIIALVPPTVLALLDGGIGAAVVVIVGYALINFAQDNVIQPVALGSELNLTPLVVFVAVVVWAWVLGAAGALLAVPLTVGLVAILEGFPSTRPIAALMRSRIEAEPGLVDAAATPRTAATRRRSRS